MTKKKKLIVTAHDFGLTNSVNQGIFDSFLFSNNIITNLSLLVTTPGFKTASEYAKKHPEISADLSISLTRNKPCLKNHKTLVDKSGYLKRANTAKWDFSIIDSYDETEIEAEIYAQYECFIKAVGRKPDALTTQRSEHGDPKILVPLVNLALKENLPIRTPAWAWFTNYGARQYVEDMGVKTTDIVAVGVKDWKGKNGFDLETDMDKLIEHLNTAQNIAELLVFVGYMDKELYEYSSVNWIRAQYLNILKRKPHGLDRLKSEFELIGYKNV